MDSTIFSSAYTHLIFLKRIQNIYLKEINRTFSQTILQQQQQPNTKKTKKKQSKVNLQRNLA